MEQEIRAFLNKFIASLSLKGVESIPFAGEAFQKGVAAVETELKEELTEDEFNKISDAFVKVPVEETYQDIGSMFMALNGEGISFSGADNPQWTHMSIKMNPYLAKRIMNDKTVFPVGDHVMDIITKEFCKAAGVPLWGAF